jgi:hypothetical protein
MGATKEDAVPDTGGQRSGGGDAEGDEQAGGGGTPDPSTA